MKAKTTVTHYEVSLHEYEVIKGMWSALQKERDAYTPNVSEDFLNILNEFVNIPME